MPEDMAMEAVRAPLKKRLPEPEESEPMPKWVIVLVPPAQAGKDTAAAFEQLAPEIVQPEPERATATRA